MHLAINSLQNSSYFTILAGYSIAAVATTVYGLYGYEESKRTSYSNPDLIDNISSGLTNAVRIALPIAIFTAGEVLRGKIKKLQMSAQDIYS